LGNLPPQLRCLPDGHPAVEVALDLLWQAISWPDEQVAAVARRVRVNLPASEAAQLRAALAAGQPLNSLLRQHSPLWSLVDELISGGGRTDWEPLSLNGTTLTIGLR
jgi:hypothetical protein